MVSSINDLKDCLKEISNLSNLRLKLKFDDVKCKNIYLVTQESNVKITLNVSPEQLGEENDISNFTITSERPFHFEIQFKQIESVDISIKTPNSIEKVYKINIIFKDGISMSLKFLNN